MGYFDAKLPERFGRYGFEGGSRCALPSESVDLCLRIHAKTDSY